MRPIRKRADRANGRRCTGPRSSEGKKRVAQNALRHGLARAIASDEPWSEPVRLLMDAIVGGIVTRSDYVWRGRSQSPRWK
jgi:hypothetical protein